MENRDVLVEKRIEESFLSLYPDNDRSLEALMKVIKTNKKKRTKSLQARDIEETAWLQNPDTVGMMLYVDLFCIDLENLKTKIDYFKSVGVTLVHLMPILKPREGESDGGFAVSNYREIDPKIGDMATFKKVVKTFHTHGIRVCIDYVVNHTANDHEWAKKAKSGDAHFKDYYITHETIEEAMKYEQFLGEVFPKVAPGNFTFDASMKKWVMTTFYPFQWDLNYENPHVLIEMVDNLLFFANLGVDMIRLDAIPYIWKTLGTDCRNLPQVHVIMNLFREVITLCAPSTALLGEAIVSPEVIVRYFGSEQKTECHVLYNASYMVEMWNGIATRDARHLAQMKAFDTPKNSVWINYARCHDDIGWGLDEEKTKNLGFDPHAHKQFLIDFYFGVLKDSFSRGELYEFDPKTGDARTSGTLASLAGLEKALMENDAYQLELALKRIYLIHALFILRKGIPMLYAGDEIGQLNAYDYKQVPEKKHDSRWLHRPPMNWEKVRKIEDKTSIEAMILNKVNQIISIRKQSKPVIDEVVIHQSNAHVLVVAQKRSGPVKERLICFNLSEDRQWVYTAEIKRYGYEGTWCETLQKKQIDLMEDTMLLGPYEFFVMEK